MFKLKGKLISAVMQIVLLITSISCNQNDILIDEIAENKDIPLSVDEMAKFGIASIEQGDFSKVFADDLFLKSQINFKKDNVYLLNYVNSDMKSIVRILPNNVSEVYFLDSKNQFINFATIIVNNINELGYIDDLTIDYGVQLRIIGDEYFVSNSGARVNSWYGDWADCTGDAITACYTEDLGCAALFTITFPLAFSAVSIACAVAVS